jgi:uncharacterized membrane protein YfcA
VTLAFPDPLLLVAAIAAVSVGYTIFGATGFGAGILMIPLLAHVFPFALLVPLVSLLDLAAGLQTGLARFREVDRREAALILPFILVGMGLGALLLLHLSNAAAIAALACFVIVHGSYQLLSGRRPRSLGRGWVVPFGLVGGMFSAWFGTGGPIYVIFLTGRVRDVRALRSTIALVVLVSAFIRIVVFGAAGLFTDPLLWGLALVLLPVQWIALRAGYRLHDRLPAGAIVRLISLVLVANGIMLLWRVASIT